MDRWKEEGGFNDESREREEQKEKVMTLLLDNEQIEKGVGEGERSRIRT